MDLTKKNICRIYNSILNKVKIITILYIQTSTTNIKTNEPQVTDAHNLTNMWTTVRQVKSQRFKNLDPTNK